MRFRFFFIGILFSFNVLAQPKIDFHEKAKEFRALKIGDKVPDALLEVINFGKNEIRLSDFEGKALILDFWATWCAPCVASFPKLDTLQQLLGNSLEIIPVTYEKKETIKPFLENIKRIKKIEVRSVINDTELQKRFPHSSVPHYVWIDKDHIVKAITYSEDINVQNLKKLISGETLALNVKSDEKIDKPNLFAANWTKSQNFLSFHALSKYMEGVPAGWGPFNDSSITISNTSLMGLYLVAYGEGLRLVSGFKYVNLLTQDSSKFTDNSGLGQYSTGYRANWIKEHGFCYSAKLPTKDKSKLWELMRNDLKNSFPDISAKFVKSIRKCLVLIKDGNTDNLTAKNKEPFSYDRNLYEIKVTNGKIKLLVMLMNLNLQKNYYDIIDETNIVDLVNIDIKADFSNLNDLNEKLRGFGLILKESMREVDILEISDNKQKANEPISTVKN